MSLAIFLMVGAAALATVGLVAGRFKKARLDIDMLDFFKRLLFGKGYENISPAELSERIAAGDVGLRLVDLREGPKFYLGHILGSESKPFDDFLKEVVVDGLFKDDLDREIVLICDTGHLSRVAASILAEEEGFTNLYSLKGGIKNWARWNEKEARKQKHRCCERLAGCCL
jgi:rhodanese-related sulfurtransferase